MSGDQRQFDEVDLRDIVRQFIASNVRQLSIDVSYFSLGIDKGPERSSTSTATASHRTSLAPDPQAGSRLDVDAASEGAVRLFDVKSPTVGVVHWSTAGGNDSSIAVGARVEAGEEVASVALLRKSVTVASGTTGIVAEVCAEHGAFVEYNQVLLRVKEDQG